MMSYELIEKSGVKVGLVHIQGELTAVTADEFRSHIAIWMGDGVHNYVFNLAQVDFIDSSGLGALISILTSLRKLKGELRLAAMQEGPRKIFEITKADIHFHIYDSYPEALEECVHSYQIDE